MRYTYKHKYKKVLGSEDLLDRYRLNMVIPASPNWNKLNTLSILGTILSKLERVVDKLN